MAAPAVAEVTSVAVQPLAGERTGVVLDWRPRSRTAIVAMPSGRMLAIHALRKVQPGTTVRVGGIKWGTPSPGIKWSAPPRGIKWGIKWGRNGTYSSRLTALRRAPSAPVQGVVVRRFGRAVAVGTRGGTIVVRMAVWLPKTGNAVTNGVALPIVGDTIRTNVTVGPRGRLHGDGVRFVSSASNTPIIPVSGRLSAVDTTVRTIRISNVSDPSYPVQTTLGVPTAIDISRLTVGREVAATAQLASDGTLRVNTISSNESFAAGNDPANQLVAPAPAGADTLGLLTMAINRWTLGRTQGEVLDAALYDSALGKLQRADAAARDGNPAVARAELDAFYVEVASAIPAGVTPGVAAEVLALADAVFDRLA
jgi:hypothetical protein